MMFVLAIFLGFLVAVIGKSTPGMLNMTIAKLSVTESQTAAMRFALGVVIVVFVQSFLGTYFAKFLDANPVFSEGLKKIGTFIFFTLTLVFLYLGFKAKKNTEIKIDLKTKKNRFIHGMTLSAFNMFAIPYYAFMSLTLASKNLFEYSILSIVLFAFSAACGSYLVFYLYAKFFKKIEHKLTFIVNNINFLIATLTGIVAISSVYKLYF
jgi:threonine/homoserine/homoserine lactone efflux protein